VGSFHRSRPALNSTRHDPQGNTGRSTAHYNPIPQASNPLLPCLLPEDTDRFEWNRGIEEIRDELTFLSIVRGGRLNQLKYHRRNLRETISNIFKRTPRGGSVMRPSPHRRRYRSSSRASSHVGAAVMIPSIVAGNIGGWSPVERPANPSPGSSKTPPVDTVPSEGPPDGNMTGLALV